MDLGLTGKAIIVTGGTQGIGEAISRVIAEEGGIPVFIGRTESHGQELLHFLDTRKKKGHFIRMDLTDPEECKKAVNETLQRFGGIHGLVNNAGANDSVGLEGGSPEAFAGSVSRNLFHYYTMAHYCIDALKASRGAIINISSKTAVTGQGGTSGYAAAKGAQLALTREWAVELLPFGIRVNAIVPAEVMTPLYERWINTFPDPEKALDHIKRNIPFEKRMTTPLEIANMVAFLLSSLSSHTTGQVIFVDGGYTHLDRVIE